MRTDAPHVGFIGLGGMGQPMARNLAKAGFPLTVWNRNPQRASPLAAAGARVADHPAGAAADVVVTMVADDRALESVLFEQLLIDRMREGSIHVSMSTISAAFAERLAEEHSLRGQVLVSAPVFGRPEAADDAKLFIVAAGPPTSLERCQPLFDAMGQRTFRMGDRPSAANVVKLSSNFLIASVIESLGEAFALIRKSGVDPDRYLDLLTNSLFAAPIYKTYGGLIAGQKYRPAGFRMPLGLKDVTLALEAARAAVVPMPFASVVRDHMIAAVAQGYDDADWSALGELAARNAGLK